MNPVCLLASRRPRGGAVNLMTISWLTAVDNDGGFACSVNQNRHTATFLAANPTFMSGFYAWLVAQVLKVFTTRWTEKKLTLNMLWSSGGMPSSHSVRPAAAPGRCDPCERAGPAAPPDGLPPLSD